MKKLSHKHCYSKDTNTASAGDLVCWTFGILPRQPTLTQSSGQNLLQIERKKERMEKVRAESHLPPLACRAGANEIQNSKPRWGVARSKPLCSTILGFMTFVEAFSAKEGRLLREMWVECWSNDSWRHYPVNEVGQHHLCGTAALIAQPHHYPVWVTPPGSSRSHVSVLAQFPAASEAQMQLSGLLGCTAEPSPCWTNAADRQLACPGECWVKADVLMKCSVSSCRRHLIGKEASMLCDEAVARVTTFFLLEKSRVNKHVNRLKSHVNCWWTYSGYLDDKVSLFQDLNFLWCVKNIIWSDLRQLQLDHLSFRSIFSFCITLPCRVWRHPL